MKYLDYYYLIFDIDVILKSNYQVKERTDVTIKMANVSRQSAEEVSDQLTAIWNNFYDGS